MFIFVTYDGLGASVCRTHPRIVGSDLANNALWASLIPQRRDLTTKLSNRVTPGAANSALECAPPPQILTGQLRIRNFWRYFKNKITIYLSACQRSNSLMANRASYLSIIGLFGLSVHKGPLCSPHLPFQFRPNACALEFPSTLR
jgi:hypothetical protein